MMAFLGFFNVYSLRVNLSVAIVAMTENKTIHYDNGTVGYVRFSISTKYIQIELLRCGHHFAGTRISMGHKRSWIDFELFLLGLYYDTVRWWFAWS